ncbi:MULTISPECIES: hypothetical protein [Mycolicibacter]|uniref:Exonuclease domain-containing protein n=2 Tax=Mycolicibacter TaxID=1073531 RepID=A0ABU5XLX8_9MYCO|nr:MULTISPECIES: hypothetical protein [unclassified Mycolicibacter]MEB3022968.1 hypothetical protein [Mycolicibacter sp. MYC098]MEB3033478.1 hypothetical protein [Mycolicibacter sp. MYC340]
MIRRDGHGSQREITIFIDLADLNIETANPMSLHISGFYTRHPQLGATLHPGQLHVREAMAAQLVYEWTAQAAVYGIHAGFDTPCLERMLEDHGLRPAWFYEPQDVVLLANEFLLRQGQMPAHTVEEASAQCGVPVPGADRHTAMGDARWAQRWYDQVCPAEGSVP